MNEMTTAQKYRQQVRENNGQYSKNTCYCCGKGAGMNYFSAGRTDTIDSLGNRWNDVALVLCDRCCFRIDRLDDAAAWAVATDPTYGNYRWPRLPRQPKAVAA